MRRLTTQYLLTCAVIGVAGAALLAPANWVSTVLFATVPFVSVGVAGLWLLPAVIGMRLLQRPGTALLVGLVSGLAIAPFSGYGLMSVATNVWWAFFVEVGFLVVGYRWFRVWQYYVGAVVVGLAYPFLASASFGLDQFEPAAVVLFYALTLVSAVAGVALGLAIAKAARRAGVGLPAFQWRRDRVAASPEPAVVPAD